MFGLQAPKRRQASAEPSAVRDVLAAALLQAMDLAPELPSAVRLMAGATLRGLTDAEARGVVRAMAVSLDGILTELHARGVDVDVLLNDSDVMVPLTKVREA